MQRSVSSDNEQMESKIKSRKSIGLSISANEEHLKERAMSESKGYEVNDNYQITFKPFKPFKAKRSVALSVITHTPTQKSSRYSVGLSAISHTPTEKYEKESVALSALHLSQQNKDENASFRSVALSAVKVIESKAPGNFDQSEKEETKQRSSNKYVSKSSNTREINQPSNYESSRKISSKRSIKQDYSCQVVHGRDKEESHSSLKIDRDAALDPYLRDRSVDAYKRNNATQFRLSQKTVSEETKNLNKQLQVSDDLTIEVNFQNKEKSVKVAPNIGKQFLINSVDSSSVSKSTKVSKMDKQVQVKNGRHVEIRTIQPNNNQYRKDGDDDEEEKKRDRRGNGGNKGKYNPYTNREKDGNQHNEQSKGKTHPRYARREGKEYKSNKRGYDEETEFSGGEQSSNDQEYSDAQSVQYSEMVVEKSRALNYSNSMKSEGIQADFSEEN